MCGDAFPYFGFYIMRPHDDSGLAVGPDNRDIGCLLYTSDAADERSSVDLGGRRIIKKKKQANTRNDTNRTRAQTISEK